MPGKISSSSSKEMLVNQKNETKKTQNKTEENGSERDLHGVQK